MPIFELPNLPFRGPGKRQYLAALDNYKAGTPRSFRIPSCHACGKTKQDLGKGPQKCSGCTSGWFCNKECQRSFWSTHKHNCGVKRSEAGFRVLNV